MIIVLSDARDLSSSDVIEWLLRNEKKFLRLNSDDPSTKLEYIDLDAQTVIVSIGDQQVRLGFNFSLWYRRKGIGRNILKLDLSSYKSTNIYLQSRDEGQLHSHLVNELNILVDYIYHFLETKASRKLSSPDTSQLNKLTVIELAKNVGLKSPSTFVVTTAESLKDLSKRNQHFITKALSNGVYYFSEKYAYYSYTEKVKEQSIQTVGSSFFPSLVQLEIKKKFELRIFYLQGEFYSMAIFSQRDENSKTDYRKVGTNSKGVLRMVPFLLPADVETKLTSLCNILRLETGSIDMIVDENNEYYFLEINPVGQFGWLSKACNYFLERKIANII